VLAIGIVFFLALLGYLPVFAGVAAVAVVIALLISCQHRKAIPADVWESEADLARDRERPVFGPNFQIELRPVVTGHPVGLVIAVALLATLYIGVPAARMFLLGVVAAGFAFGAFLRWRNR
jgi:hypothetical protein